MALCRNVSLYHGGIFEDEYVQPRYKTMKPEGFVDPRDVVKGPHTVSHTEAGGRETTMEGMKGWTARQRSMHSEMGKTLSRRK